MDSSTYDDHPSIQPRSYLPARERRSDSLPSTFLGWIPAIAKADPEQIIQKNGLDAYCFLRFLRLMVLVSVLILIYLVRDHFIKLHTR